MKQKIIPPVIAACALVLSACGSDNSDSGSADGTDAKADTSSAQEKLDGFTEPATSIQVDIPLTQAPEPGKTVAWLAGNISAVQDLKGGMENSTKALGWTLDIFTFDPSDPQSVGAAMVQAVNKGVDYIVTSGAPSSQYAEALASAKSAGIPVVQSNIAPEPEALDQGVLTCIACGDIHAEFAAAGSAWITVDSGGSAQVGYFNVSDYTILNLQLEEFKKVFPEDCPGCKLDEQNASITNMVNGDIPALAVAWVQTHPDAKYLFFAFGQMASGVRAALESAGIGQDVRIVTSSPSLDNIQELIDGKEQAMGLLPYGEQGYVVLDALARDSLGMDQLPDDLVPLNVELWTEENVPEPAQVYFGAPDYESQFEKLWNVG